MTCRSVPTSVVIVGEAGTGTSSLLSALHSQLSFRCRSAGSEVRRALIQRNVDINNPGSLYETDEEFDLRIDRANREFIADDGTALDCRLGLLATEGMSHVLKVRLICDPEVRYQRIAAREGIALSQAAERTKARDERDLRRLSTIYKKTRQEIYGLHHFDRVFDTTDTSTEVCVRVIQSLCALPLFDGTTVPMTCCGRCANGR